MIQREFVHLVLVGGGHSHLAVLRAFAMRPEPGVRITVIAREWHTPYSGMLPGLIARVYGTDECHIDLSPLSHAAGARLIADEVTGLQAERRLLTLASGRTVRYDLLSINCGIAPDMSALLRGSERVVPVKPIGQFLERWRALRAAMHVQARAGAEPQLLVVGGGAGGIELALAARSDLRALPSGVTLIEGSPALGAHLPARGRAALIAALAAARVQVLTGDAVVAVEPGFALTASGRQIPADHVLWVTAGAAPDWLRHSDVHTDPGGFVAVLDTLRSVSHAEVFAAGDAAGMVNAPRPKAGVFAVRQGAILAINLRQALLDRPLRVYQPQRRFLALISLGDRRAVGVRGDWSRTGAWLWRWKDWIDRRFVNRFALDDGAGGMHAGAPMAASAPSRLPQARAAPTTPDCAGCAAKLGAGVLSRALAGVDAPGGAGVLVGLADRDDAAVLAGDSRPLALTVDGFRALVADPREFGALAMNHALGDAYAMGAAPAGVLAMVTVAHAAPALQEADLSDVLGGALGVLTPLGIPLLGGHSAEGLELSVGITVVAHVPAHGWTSKGALVSGDVLVLTKPLGVGALFAAQMRGAARSRWLRAAIVSMLQPLADAAAALRAAGARGCTDVTGFGLLGHTREMAQASGIGVELWLTRVPYYDGALQVVAAGISSSLQASNEHVLADFSFVGCAPDDPRVRLLADPQTCGGLLAGVPEASVASCLEALRGFGYVAAAVGRVTAARRDGLIGVVLG